MKLRGNKERNARWSEGTREPGELKAINVRVNAGPPAEDRRIMKFERRKMRMFMKVKSRINSEDPEFRILCVGGGDDGVRDNVRKVDTRVYSFKSREGGGTFLGLAVDVPFPELCPIVDGVRIIVKEFGRSYGAFEEPPLERCMKVKKRFSFSGTDFEYIQYLASALASAESLLGPFRAFVVAEEGGFLRAGLPIPQDAPRDEGGKIMLWDTKELYAKSPNRAV
jgi:hypothetical protein